MFGHPTRNLISALTVLIGPMWLCGASSPAKAQDGARMICHGEEIPNGFVITGTHIAPHCPTLKAYGVRRPGDRLAVCWNSQIPSRYVITDQNNFLLCDDPPGINDPRGMWIQVARGEMEVCRGSRVPSGFRVLRLSHRPTCPGFGDNAKIISE